METRSKKKRNNERKDQNKGRRKHRKLYIYRSQTKHVDLPKEALTHVRVDSTVGEISMEAFKDCKDLVNVQLPETLSRIGKGAFQSCPNLKSVEFLSRNASPKTPSTTDNLDDETIVFPKALLRIESLAFAYCRSLRKVIFCSVSTKLDSAVFGHCQSLVSVELPEGLQVITPGLFVYCKSLSIVKMPSSLIKIGGFAFKGCSTLASVDLPHGLMEIDECSFEDCSSIETIRVPHTVSAIGECAFQDCNSIKHIKLPPTLERIESCMLKGCNRLEYLEIPSTVSSIGECALYGCSNISHIKIPPSVNHIGHWALKSCLNLISIELPEGFSFDIELNGCSSLVNVVGPLHNSRLLSWEDFPQTVELGRAADGHDDLAHRLKHRFDDSPLNKLCYYQSYHYSGEAMEELRCLMDENPLAATTQVDRLGMTPFHVLSLSQTPNVDMLLAVMEGGRLDHIIFGLDSFRSTPMDYICLNRMPTSTGVIRRVLHKRFEQLLDLDRSWKSDMLQAVDEALTGNWRFRRREVIAIYLKLAKYERKEIVSLMELFLWKTKIDEVGAKEETANREFCRINSGASIVIPQLLSFLDKLDLEDHYFPFCSKV